MVFRFLNNCTLRSDTQSVLGEVNQEHCDGAVFLNYLRATQTRSPGCSPGRSEIPTTRQKKKKKSMHVVRWSSDKMCPGKQECWVAASPGAAAGVDAR